ncbi:MAG TPA: hypothetical protein VGO51_00555 [Burkholderiaceae bacterium]|nr:hypothetical protein [Burkholderiaceae bacterium]
METVFVDALAGDFPVPALGATLDLPFDFTAAAFTAGFAVFLDRTDLAEAGFAFFAEEVWVFAGFFIAFAMESTNY